ncbi:MAG: hypothetical protein RDU83_01540 [bacterium]|nr:hypothetical protein [bacterium]
MNGIPCAHHADRLALTYCSGCGKALCGSCVVRLGTGNYCRACAEAPDLRPRRARGRSGRTWLWVGIAVLVLVAYVVSRLF